MIMRNKLITLITLIALLTINSCSTLYVAKYSSAGIKPNVREEMIINQKRITIEKRKTRKIHNKRRRNINKLQNKKWNYD